MIEVATQVAIAEAAYSYYALKMKRQQDFNTLITRMQQISGVTMYATGAGDSTRRHKTCAYCRGHRSVHALSCSGCGAQEWL